MKVPTTCETDSQEVLSQENQRRTKEKHEVHASHSTMTVDDLTDVSLLGALHDTLQGYRGAIGEYVVGLKGGLRDQKWVCGLVDIANSKVNPKFKYQNIHQQAGFSSELKTMVRQNAEARIQGEAIRTMRADDLDRVNDQLNDTVKIDENGGSIEGAAKLSTAKNMDHVAHRAGMETAEYGTVIGDSITVDGLAGAASLGALHDTVQRYGGAIGEYIVGLTGMDNLRNQKWVRGLVDNAKSKVNPKYKYQNIHQQAGFSAEINTVTNQNAEARIQGDTTRTMRTDDIGRKNDQLIDTVKFDGNGDIIEGSGTQVKFIGYSENDPSNEGSASRAYKKLMSEKFAKYHENDVLIEVPKDQYDKLIAEADKNIGKLQKQLERVTDQDVRAKLEAKLERAETLRKNLRQSSVTSKEAVFAREHPYLSTAKNMCLVAHRAGIEAAKYGAVIGGSVAIVQQTVAVLPGKVEAKEAAVEVAKSTVKRAGQSYIVAAGGSLVKGAMEQAAHKSVRAASMTGLPQVMVQAAISTSPVLYKYFTGKIDGKQCVQELSQQSANMLGTSMFTKIGQAIIPIPIVGGLVGGMAGYALSSATYDMLKQRFADQDLARERSRKSETTCKIHIQQMNAHRAQFETLMATYLAEEKEFSI
ncbi:hypothetical protein [Veillonella sp. VA139]|uniref:hypothetical protein n=1 Tax=Veillonella sp. VA139 TaxID=741830 RepID=UPI000F8F31F1|nr:hypothetical protein [Veillonella sp. VA139]